MLFLGFRRQTSDGTASTAGFTQIAGQSRRRRRNPGAANQSVGLPRTANIVSDPPIIPFRLIVAGLLYVCFLTILVSVLIVLSLWLFPSAITRRIFVTGVLGFILLGIVLVPVFGRRAIREPPSITRILVSYELTAILQRVRYRPKTINQISAMAVMNNRLDVQNYVNDIAPFVGFPERAFARSIEEIEIPTPSELAALGRDPTAHRFPRRAQLVIKEVLAGIDGSITTNNELGMPLSPAALDSAIKSSVLDKLIHSPLNDTPKRHSKTTLQVVSERGWL